MSHKTTITNERFTMASSTKKMNEQLLEAVKAEKESEVVALINAGANIETVDKYKNTALIIASLRDNASLVKILIDSSANIEHTNKYGNTALITAENNNRTAISLILISAGADIETPNNEGLNVLDIAEKRIGPKRVTVIKLAFGARQACNEYIKNTLSEIKELLPIKNIIYSYLGNFFQPIPTNLQTQEANDINIKTISSLKCMIS